MDGQRSGLRIGVLSGLATTLGVIGPLLTLILILFVLEVLLGRSASDGPVWAVIVLIGAGLICGGVWGGLIARLASTGHERRMQAVGALVIIPSVLLDVWLLTTLDEHLILQKLGIEGLPTYQQFGVVFTISVFIVAALSALALSLVNIKIPAAFRIAALTGLAAAAAFLLVVIIMDLIGFRVGAPRPSLWPDLPPMPLVTILGSIVGAFVGGGLLGWLLSEETKKLQDASPVQDQALSPGPSSAL